MHPDLHLLLHRLAEDERSRRRGWQPGRPLHPPRWRTALASRLRSAADRLAEPAPAPPPADPDGSVHYRAA